MKYMMLIYMEDQAMNEAEREHCYVESTELAQELKANGHYLAASPLQPTSTATSIRVRDGRRLVTDGPFAETREQLGGYFMVEAGNLDEAIGIAGRIPGARVGTVEIRPLLSCRICRLARTVRGVESDGGETGGMQSAAGSSLPMGIISSYRRVRCS